MIRLFATEVGNLSLWQDYLSVLRDPAHVLVELTVELLTGGIFGAMLWPRFKAWMKRHDEEEHPVCDLVELQKRVEELESRTSHKPDLFERMS